MILDGGGTKKFNAKIEKLELRRFTVTGGCHM